MAEIKYEVSSALQCCLSGPGGWERQLNLISWNDGEPKYDIRDCIPGRYPHGQGHFLSGEELAILKGILEDLEL